MKKLHSPFKCKYLLSTYHDGCCGCLMFSPSPAFTNVRTFGFLTHLYISRQSSGCVFQMIWSKVPFKLLWHFTQLSSAWHASGSVCTEVMYRVPDWLMNVNKNKLPFSTDACLFFSLHYTIIFLSQQELVGCDGSTPFTWWTRSVRLTVPKNYEGTFTEFTTLTL